MDPFEDSPIKRGLIEGFRSWRKSSHSAEPPHPGDRGASSRKGKGKGKWQRGKGKGKGRGQRQRGQGQMADTIRIRIREWQDENAVKTRMGMIGIVAQLRHETTRGGVEKVSRIRIWTEGRGEHITRLSWHSTLSCRKGTLHWENRRDRVDRSRPLAGLWKIEHGFIFQPTTEMFATVARITENRIRGGMRGES